MCGSHSFAVFIWLTRKLLRNCARKGYEIASWITEVGSVIEVIFSTGKAGSISTHCITPLPFTQILTAFSSACLRICWLGAEEKSLGVMTHFVEVRRIKVLVSFSKAESILRHFAYDKRCGFPCVDVKVIVFDKTVIWLIDCLQGWTLWRADPEGQWKCLFLVLQYYYHNVVRADRYKSNLMFFSTFLDAQNLSHPDPPLHWSIPWNDFKIHHIHSTSYATFVCGNIQ